MVESGTVQWCDTCGAYAESRTSRRMAGICRGPPPAAAGKGGMRQQLMALKAGRHPVTGLRMPAPCSSNAALGSGTYTRLRPHPGAGQGSSDESSVEPSSFMPYEPRVIMRPSPAGESAERKRWLMSGRLRCKIGREAALLRRRRRKEAKSEAREVISSFIGDAEGDGGQDAYEPNCDEQTAAEDNECEIFWANLPVEVSREKHLLNIPTRPGRSCHVERLMSGSRCKQPAVQRRAELGRRCTVLTCFEFGCNGGHS